MKQFVLVALMLTNSCVIFCQSANTDTATGKKIFQRFVPNGPYKETSRNITVKLSCTYPDRNNFQRPTVLDITNMGEVAVENVKGNLTSTAGSAEAAANRFI